jgi:hypothetical protein
LEKPLRRVGIHFLLSSTAVPNVGWQCHRRGAKAAHFLQYNQSRLRNAPRLWDKFFNDFSRARARVAKGRQASEGMFRSRNPPLLSSYTEAVPLGIATADFRVRRQSGLFVAVAELPDFGGILQ